MIRRNGLRVMGKWREYLPTKISCFEATGVAAFITEPPVVTSPTANREKSNTNNTQCTCTY